MDLGIRHNGIHEFLGGRIFTRHFNKHSLAPVGSFLKVSNLNPIKVYRPKAPYIKALGASCSGQMSEQKEIMDEESFNREFCEHLEWHLGHTFEKSGDKKVYGLWCDGILDPFIERQLTKKSVNDTKTIVTTAFIGYDGQGKYEMTIKFGQYSLRRYAKGSSMIDCIPSDDSMDWITVDMENKKIEIRLK